MPWLVHGWTHAGMGWTDERTDGRMDRWADGRPKGWTVGGPNPSQFRFGDRPMDGCLALRLPCCRASKWERASCSSGWRCSDEDGVCNELEKAQISRGSDPRPYGASGGKLGRPDALLLEAEAREARGELAVSGLRDLNAQPGDGSVSVERIGHGVQKQDSTHMARILLDASETVRKQADITGGKGLAWCCRNMSSLLHRAAGHSYMKTQVAVISHRGGWMRSGTSGPADSGVYDSRIGVAAIARWSLQTHRRVLSILILMPPPSLGPKSSQRLELAIRAPPANVPKSRSCCECDVCKSKARTAGRWASRPQADIDLVTRPCRPF